MKENGIVLFIVLIVSICWFSGCTDSEKDVITIESFTVTPSIIKAGETAILEWIVSGADTVTIDNGIGSVNLTGSLIIQPDMLTTYTLTATKGSNSKVKSVNILVDFFTGAENAVVVAMREDEKIKITLTTGGDNYPSAGYLFADSVTIRLNGTVLAENNIEGNTSWEEGESLYIGGSTPTLDDDPLDVEPLSPGDYLVTIIIKETVVFDDSIKIV